MSNQYLTIRIDDANDNDDEAIEKLKFRTASMIQCEEIDVVWDLSGLSNIKFPFVFKTFGKLITEHGPALIQHIGFSFPTDEYSRMVKLFQTAGEIGLDFYHGDDLGFVNPDSVYEMGFFDYL